MFGMKNPTAFELWWWSRRIARMQRCRTTAELLRRHGEPTHRTGGGDLAIWHYPIRRVGKMDYAIHALVGGEVAEQVYLYMELAESEPPS